MSSLPMSAVVVHPDGAVVSRSGKLAIVDGEVRIRALPLLLDPTSVRVALRGTPIRQVRVEIDFEGEDRGPRPEEREAWRRARDELVGLDAAIEGARRERDAIARIAPKHVDARHRDAPSAEQWAKWGVAEGAIDERVAAIDDELRAFGRRRVELVERIGGLARAVEEHSDQSWWRRWRPTRRVSVETGGEGEVDVELSYRVPGARWSPAYTLDADGSLRGGRFAMRATIAQATGEDWTQVAIALSSAPSARRVDVPELPALRLGSRSPPAPAAWRDLPTDLDGLFPPALPAADKPEPPPPEPTRAPSPPPARPPPDLADLAPSLVASIEPQPATRARGVIGAVGGAVGELARAARAPAPMTAAPAKPKAAPGARPAPPPPSQPEGGEVELEEAWLDYGRLRLAPGTEARSRRGRLWPASDDDWLAERSAPVDARARFEERLGAARIGVRQVADRPLPPHHVLPAPIGGSDVRIEGTGRVDVPSDGSPHTIAVVTWPIELDVSYRAVPRHDARAFRRVAATVPYDRPLLPGPVDVYVEGRLELTSPWAGSPGRGQFLIGLGAEDRLKLVRNVRYREESAGLFGGGRRLHTAIEVRIASSLPRPVVVEVLERVPVPLDGAQVTVEPGEAVPPAYPYEGEPDGPILKGGRRQRVEVAPGAEARAVLAYALSIGGKDELVGGDRRG